jgi:hypothetical protein
VDTQMEIESRQLQDGLLKLAKDMGSRSGRQAFRPVTDAEWKSMSPAQQLERIEDRFLTMRAEVLLFRMAIQEHAKNPQRYTA